MPDLRDLNLQISYGPTNDRLREFFIPAMSASIRYDRAAGFFSSTMLAVAAAGVTKLILNGGKMRLLCGADLSENDVAAINEGHATLAEQVEKRLLTRLVLPENDYVENRLKALAWLVGTGQLQIQVVLPTDKQGRPIAASKSDCYYHPKEGLFEDAAGNRIGFSGSVNESATALEDNYESFMVFNSWDGSSPHLAQIRHRFDRLWEGKEPDWVAMPIPEAVKHKLLKLRPTDPPKTEFGQEDLEPVVQDDPVPAQPIILNIAQRERILFQFLRDIPHLLNSERVGLETCTVRPWPHQTRVADTIIKRFPERFLLCDEVGLGKTIEAGLALRQLILSGVVRRALILVPKSVLVQWQEELYEKFILNVPRYDGSTFFDVFGREVPGNDVGNPWNAHPIFLASSHLAKRRDRQGQLLAAENWDLIVVDEAHHARRRDFLNPDQFRPNRLLELLRGPVNSPGLCDRTRGLLLLTATPMQIDPREVFDLLELLGVGGRWGVERNFLRYFEELRQPFEDVDWSFVLSMLDDYFVTGGEWNTQLCQLAESSLGPVVWDQLRRLHESANAESIIRQLTPTAQGFLRQIATRHTPLWGKVFRNTRTLLHEYHKRGFLKDKIPFREPTPEWIEMEHEESELYLRIEEYIQDHYQRYEAERKGLGFIMTVYRRRLTSSFYAIAQSLERRLAYLNSAGNAAWLADEDIEQEDLEEDVAEFFQPEDGAEGSSSQISPLFLGEIEFVNTFLYELRALGTDSKFEQLAKDLTKIFKKRDSVIVFTQYTDTMDYLRDKLRHVYGALVACYSGRGGERWNGNEWIVTSKEHVKTAFRESREIKILLCTESASEGLNLQTCGVLINYEMPWNPMRVERRIGRIDRIGQEFDRVWIRNYFYQGTVEADVYQRLDERIASFESVVGELQPILSQVARVIEAVAMANNKQRGELIAKAVDEINRQVRTKEMSTLDLDRLTANEVQQAAPVPVPITLLELQETLMESKALEGRFKPHQTLTDAYLLDWHGQWQTVTFDPKLFDAHPNTVSLLSYGCDLLEAVLQVVDQPTETKDCGIIARCEVGKSAVGYYGSPDGRTVLSLQTLRKILDTKPILPLFAEQQSKFEHQFSEAAHSRQLREEKAAADQQKAQLSSLTEEIRQLLLEAAYVELAQAENRGLFDEELPFDFSEQAFQRLKRHKTPFAGAMKMVGSGLPIPRAEDPIFLRIKTSKSDSLTRRFDAVRGKLTDRLRELMEMRQKIERSGTTVSAPRGITSQLFGMSCDTKL